MALCRPRERGLRDSSRDLGLRLLVRDVVEGAVHGPERDDGSPAKLGRLPHGWESQRRALGNKLTSNRRRPVLQSVEYESGNEARGGMLW